MNKAFRYWHTLRYLKAEQIIFQILRRVSRRQARTGECPPLRVPVNCWTQAISGQPTFHPPGKFTFLGQDGNLADIGWNGPERSDLWRYNQHYFADLQAVDAAHRTNVHSALIIDWINRNPPGHGTGWHPYPTSLRIVAWIKWALAGNSLPTTALASLADQARWLTRNLERHILGNHLFVNAKALVFAGLFFDGFEASSWLDIGLRVLAREFPEQILPDGGHFELSPMYHILALEDVLDLINVAKCFSSGLDTQGRSALELWQSRVPDMLHWMAVMQHPDGDIGFFNDAAFDIAPTPLAVDDYSVRLGFSGAYKLDPGLTLLQSSGYARLEAGPAVLLADVAQVGPDYQPGHAHADTLSFELSLHGQRLISNSGTSVYGTSPERLRQRGTAAHATLVLDGEDSSEVWGGFRVARRARVRSLQHKITPDGLCLEASHDGYTRLKGAPIHVRRWYLKSNSLHVTDRVEGRGRHQAEVVFPLVPGWTVEPISGRQCNLRGPKNQLATLNVSTGWITTRQFSHHPKFGCHELSALVTVTIDGQLPLNLETRLTWEPTCAC